MQKSWQTKEEKQFRKFLFPKEVIMSKIKVVQTRSIIDRPKIQKRTIKALGLGRPNWEKVHNDTPQIRGMVKKVAHLLKLEEIEE